MTAGAPAPQDHPRAQRLSSVIRDSKRPNSRPRDAASLLVLRKQAGRTEILMGRRPESHVFMPGVFVFPGGRVERADALVPTALEPDAKVCNQLGQHCASQAGEGRAKGLLMAAIRELYEETGIALGRVAEGGIHRKPGHHPWAGFLGHGLLPDPSGLHLLAHAITPPRRPRRFDTRFLAVDADDAGFDLEPIAEPTEELDQICWLPLNEIIDPDGKPAIKLAPITAVILEELHDHLQANDGRIAHAPVPLYRYLYGRFQRDIIET